MANDIYSINFDQQAIDLIPPDKRLPKNVSLLQALFAAVQWARDLILGSYKTGATAPLWSPGMYNTYEQVIFNKAVYESLIDNNTDQPTTSNWRLIQANFIGVDERVKFNASKCVLEYSLNKRFRGQFRMPPDPAHSDIYISNLPPVPYGFRIGATKASTVGATTSSDTIGSLQTFRQINGYQVNIPVAIFALTSNQEMSDFINLYNAYGINYTIVTY